MSADSCFKFRPLGWWNEGYDFLALLWVLQYLGEINQRIGDSSKVVTDDLASEDHI